MSKVGIVTDSGANLPPELVKEKRIRVIPMKIQLGSETYRDGVDLIADDFFPLLEKLEDIPDIAPPTSLEFLEMFESMKEEGFESAVCILLSSNICHSYNAACEARDLVRPFPVVIIDSHAATMSQGFMVLEAVRAAEEGLSTTEVVDRAWRLRPLVNFYGIAGMVHYLVRSGRIGQGAAFFRALLNIKPIISINKDDGCIYSVAKVTSRQKGLNYLLRKVEQAVSPGKKLHAAVLHADEHAEAEHLYNEIKQRYECAELYLQQMTPVISSQTGPGVVGVSFYFDE